MPNLSACGAKFAENLTSEVDVAGLRSPAAARHVRCC